MIYILNIALFISAYQSIDSKRPWWERLPGGVTYFLIMHAGFMWLLSRQGSPDSVDEFFINLFSYIKIFDSLFEIFPILFISSTIYFLTFLLRKFFESGKHEKKS